ncbi:type I polyketide synthase [Pseudofrankia asymbiotica]|uniref:Beta-ketoacyl synthase n=1 Tax=Pseudofrankia asymbiotica TaxID=1834516 RepID=A0A1V2IIA5_9ACTN|nr:type I polyketide synthase [Pseudofrankia asymbiotica]ONH32908.1 beta-ketoacyl synthase [Pseudofrankia asymbiotica]
MTGRRELTEAELRAWLTREVARLLGVQAEAVGEFQPLGELGLASRDAVALAGELEDLLDMALPATLVWENPTVAAIAARLAALGAGASASAGAGAGGHYGVGGDGVGGDGVGDSGRHAAAVPSAEPVAIVGMGCRLPGGSADPEAFWDFLTRGGDGIREVPADRWEPFVAPGSASALALAGLSRLGGFLDDVAGFDPGFFGIAPREAELVDPQHRLLLEVVWEALENAGVPPESLRGTSTGVFVGLSLVEYAHLTASDLSRVEAHTSTGAAMSLAANRISYTLDLRGPSIALDTACSSSLVAVHTACASLRAGESAVAIAGGVNLLLAPAVSAAFASAGLLAPDGHCKAFAASADGIARGEGCGAIVLKRLSDARSDGDRIWAVIRGSAVNSDGRSNGITAPNPRAQEAVLRAAYQAAGVDPAEVDYVEAHGTGTPLGDPIEAAALGAVVGAGAGRKADRPLLIGSVKTNIGHLEAAAGITGLIKVALGLTHGMIPASLHFDAPSPHIRFDEAGLRVVTEPRPWPRVAGRPAQAGVSGFGFGGTNAHVVLQEWAADGRTPADAPTPDDPATDPVRTLLLSGANPARLRRQAGRLAAWLDEPAGRIARPADVAAILARRHSYDAPVSAAVVGRTRGELADALTALADEVDTATVVAPAAPGRCPARGGAPGTVWVFSGQGSQWAGMGRRLLAAEPDFAVAVDWVEPVLRRRTGRSLRAALTGDTPFEGLEATQLVLFGTQVALARLWRARGLEPAAVLGFSMGEVSAAVVSGALDLDSGVRVMATRARLLASLEHGDGGELAMVELSDAEWDTIAPHFPDVAVAVHTSPTQRAVGGDPTQLRALCARLEAMGRPVFPMPIPGGAHSSAVDVLLAELTGELSDITGRPPSVAFYGTTLDDPREPPAFDAAYWAANARRPVRFAHALAAAGADGHATFLEVSPHPIGARAVRQTLGAARVTVAGTLRRGTDDRLTFRANLARLALAGGDAGARAALSRETAGPAPTRRAPEPPTAAWDRQRYWFRPTAARRPAAGAGHPLLGQRVELPEGGRHLWSADVGTAAVGWLADHTVHGAPVLPGAAHAEIALAAATAVFGSPDVEVSDLEIHRIVPLADRTTITVSLRVTDSGGTVDVHTRPARSSHWVRCATATVALAGPDAGLQPGPDADADADADVDVGMGVDADAPAVGSNALGGGDGLPVDVYAAFEAVGQRYGPAFAGVSEARCGVSGGLGVARGRVRLPDAATGHPLLRAHPALLDACLQTLAAAAAGLLPAQDDRALYLPVGIGRLWVGAAQPREGTCHATLARAGTDDAGLVGAVRLVGDDGAVLLAADEIYLRRLHRDDVPVALESMLFESRWEPAQLASPAAGDGLPDSGAGRREDSVWVVVTPMPPDEGLAARLVARLGEAHGTVVTLALDDAPALAAALAVRAARGDAAGILLLVPDDAAPAETHKDDAPAPAAGVPGLVTEASALVAGAAALARAVLEAGFAWPPRLWLVSRGAAVAGAGEAGRPGPASLRGLVRVLAFEHPLLRATLVDLDPAGDPLPDLLAELAADAADDEVAWRGGRRLVGRLARAALAAAPAARPAGRKLVRPEAYVVTGGLGGLGLTLAGRLADGGAARLVLGGRRRPSADVEAALARLRAGGRTDVVVLRGDIGRPGTAERLVAAATAGGTRLAGVAHAAGTLVDQALLTLDRDSLERVWAPKVTGTWLLHQATEHLDPDWWLVFSSAAGLLGSPGQASYAAANAWMDAFTRWRRATGRPATSIQWGAWSQVGRAAGTTNPLLEPLSPAAGLEALEAVLASGRDVTGVTRLSPERAIRLLPEIAGAAYFGPLLAEAGPGDGARDGARDGAGDDGWPGAAALRSADPVVARGMLAARLRTRVAQIMGFPPDRAGLVDPDVPLTELGLDSLMAVRARGAVESDVDVVLPVRLLLRGASLADVERHVAAELGLPEAVAGDGRVDGDGWADGGRDGGGPRRAAAAARGRGYYIPPRDPTERWLVVLWEEALGRSPIGVTDDLATAGRDGEPPGRAVAAVVAAVADRLGADAAPGAGPLLAAGTVERMANLLRERLEGNGGNPLRVLRAAGPGTGGERPGGDGQRPLFLFHPAGGPTSVYHALVSRLPAGPPVYGLERLDDLRDVETKADRYLEIIREVAPAGPYRLGGWSFGGVLAYEAARRLVAAGETVEVVAMIDSILPLPVASGDARELVVERFRRFAAYVSETYHVDLDLPYDELADLDEDAQVERLGRLLASSAIAMTPGVLEHQRTSYADARIAERYQPRPYGGRVVLFRAASAHRVTVALDPRYDRAEAALGWDSYCSDLDVVVVPGDHTSVIDPPAVGLIADHLGVVLAGPRPAG